MNPLDLPLAVSFFADHSATSITREALSLHDLADRVMTTTAPAKSALPWLKLATFGDQRTARGSLRNNANVVSVSGIEADYDQHILTVDQAAALLRRAGVAALVYTSPSHHPDMPRWRVLCPCSTPQPPSARADLVGRLNHVLGGILAVESFTLSQAYYLGAVDPTFHTVDTVPGDFIDRLTEIPVLLPVRAAAEPLILPMLPPDSPPDAHATSALKAACSVFDEVGSDLGRHQQLLRATNAVAPFILSGHLNGDEVADQLEGAMTDSGRAPNPGEVTAALGGAMRIGRAYVPPTGGAEFADLPIPVQPADPDVVHILEITEEATARSLARHMDGRFVFDHSDQAWFLFNPGTGWEQDKTGRTLYYARLYVDMARTQWGHKASEKTATMGFCRAVCSGCQCDPLLAVTNETWDADPMILGVPGGHVDLRTGEMHTATASAMVRRRTSVAPTRGPMPLWLDFLEQATGGDQQFIAWLQRLCGYALTGDVSEEMLAFVYGPGGNGKGVFLRTLSAILAEYAYQAPAALLDADSNTNREYQLARLDGVRLLLISETEAESRLAEAFVKEITGNEGKINARHPYGRPFEFRSEAKVLVVGNHAPKLNGRSNAMERRLRVAPFTRTPSRPDPDLKDKLVTEYPAILDWMIAGCVMWQADRLGMCRATAEATDAYFEEQDSLAQWMTERLDVSNPEAKAASSDLLHDFNVWLRARGEPPTNAKAFKESMLRFPKYPHRHTNSGKVYVGLALQGDGSDGILESRI